MHYYYGNLKHCIMSSGYFQVKVSHEAWGFHSLGCCVLQKEGLYRVCDLPENLLGRLSGCLATVHSIYSFFSTWVISHTVPEMRYKNWFSCLH